MADLLERYKELGKPEEIEKALTIAMQNQKKNEVLRQALKNIQGFTYQVTSRVEATNALNKEKEIK